MSGGERLLPLCILAGGLATRLGDIAKDRPKALLEVAGEPFAFHQLRALRRAGADRIVYCVGHLAESIEATVGDGTLFDLQISYVRDGPTPAGTAGAVRGALPLLGPRFFVLYGDTLLRIDYADVQRRFLASGAPALMTVLRNEGRWDASNACFEAGWVIAYNKRTPSTEMRWIDYGLGMFEAAVFSTLVPDATDLGDVQHELAASAKLAGYEATERFYEIGTPQALAETDQFLRTRRPAD